MSSAASNTAAPNISNQSSPPSYATAASNRKLAGGQPLIATGTHAPVVSSISSLPQNGKAPMNGRPPITPAVPTVAPTPAVAHGSSNSTTNVNGASNPDTRDNPVILNAPGGPNGMASNKPVFGFQESQVTPIVAHSTPQPSSAAPMPIPPANNTNNRIPSPAHSPQPIPMTSGGNAPGGLHPSAPKPQFGSHRNDEGDRHMRQNMGQPPMHNPNPHHRKDSHHLEQPPMVGQPRGNYHNHRGGGGRGYYGGGNQQMYGPGGYNGPRAGPPSRGGMTSSPYPRNAAPNFGGPAQSPSMAPASPMMNAGHAASPAMQPSAPYQHQYPGAGPYPSQMPQPMGQHPPPYGSPYPGMNPGYPMPSYASYGVPSHHGMPPFPHQGPQAPMNQGFAPTAQPFTPGAGGFNAAGGAPMSRNSSALSHSERPGSSGPPPMQPGSGNLIASGSHPNMTQAKAPVVSGANSSGGGSFFERPKKSSAVSIKNDQGETVSFGKLRASATSTPASTNAAIQTPPVAKVTPPPEAKGSPAPSDGKSAEKSAEEKKKEFADSIAAAAKKESAEAQARAEAEKKAKEEAEAKAAAEAKANEEAEAKAKEEAEAKAREEAAAEAKAKAEAEAKAKEEAEAKKKAEAEAAEAAAKAKEEAEAAEEAKAKEDAEKAAAAEAPKSKPTLAELEAKGIDSMSPEEQDLYFDLLDQQDAEREAEQAKITAQKKEEQDKAKAKADQERAKNAEEEDRKLREQEAEAERLEAAKEKQREEREKKGENVDMATALKARIEDLKAPSAAPSVPAVTNKMAGLSISKGAATPANKAAGSQKPKPAALNLQPLKTNEAPLPSAALQSLKSARFLRVMSQDIYPEGIKSPNPALTQAAKGKSAPFRYDMNFMLQFQGACKEPPSLDFQQQVKTLIGEEGGNRSATAKASAGAGRQNSRAGGGGFSAMGSFGTGGPMGGGGRTLPAGTSSEQRFAMSSNPMARPGGPNPMGSFNRGAFPGGASMSRNPSNTGMVPNSPRTGSRRGGGSKRPDPHAAKHEAKANAAMPLTQGMDLKPITTSSTGWKPMSVGRKAAAAAGSTDAALMDPATVQRKVKAALNKMTPEKFERLSEQILVIANQSKSESDGRTLRQVIQLVFEKATDEAHWSEMYAKFCKTMLERMGPDIRDEGILDKNGNVVCGGALFRKYLLNRCQEEFERPREGAELAKNQEAQMLSDEYYVAAAAKRRELGLVQFIGELFKLGMLTERIMHECVRKLLDFEGKPDEAEIESLCKLLRTIGATLDNSEKGSNMMNAYFDRINVLIGQADLPSRIKFMLMDVSDLRRKGWAGNESKGPKTLEEIRAEQVALQIQKQVEQSRNQKGGRPPAGRGDVRNFSSQYAQPTSNQIGMDDLRRLKGSTNRATSHNITLGPSLMLQSRSNSGRRMGPGGSLTRGSNDDPSRTATPTNTSRNTFALLAQGAHPEPASPPSTSASPNISKATPASSDEKKSD